MDFGQVSTGDLISVVGKVKVFDISHDRHRMILEPSGIPFNFTGLLESGHDSYTLLDVEMIQQFPIPHLVSNPASRVMFHDQPDWMGLHDLIDVCAGFGGMAQGAHAAGFFVKVAVDFNPKMLSLYQKQFNCDVVLGDIGSHDVVYETWSAAKGASTLSAGFSCQPYSWLGDGRSKLDPRASCLTKVLTMARLLRIHLLIL